MKYIRLPRSWRRKAEQGLGMVLAIVVGVPIALALLVRFQMLAAIIVGLLLLIWFIRRRRR